MAPPPIVASGSPALNRVHETRVELDCMAGEEELRRALEIISGTEALTDVVLHSARDAVRSLSRVGEIVDRLASVSHITSVRLRSQLFRSRPEVYTDGVLGKLGQLNLLRVTNPLRLELEVLFLHPTELGSRHARIVRNLRQRGVTVYANVPLLPFVNDSPEEMLALSAGCRRMGIEFHHLILAGMPLQAEWNVEHPVHLGHVIDLASHLRQNGSGRELPAYIIRTPLGEVDFALSCEVAETDESGGVLVRLLTYTLDDYRAMDPGFTPPSPARFDERGYPVVPVRGLVA
jgi:L-lysine 2,3-aminomutase